MISRAVVACLVVLLSLWVADCEEKCDKDYELRLTNGTDVVKDMAGLVEVCYNSTWHRICGEEWSNQTAQVMCKLLGLPSEGGRATSFSRSLGMGTNYLPKRVRCSGNNTNFEDCLREELTMQNCPLVAGVECSELKRDQDMCDKEYEIRLTNDTHVDTDMARLVEVCYNSTWHHICEKWNDQNAQVVCKQLGLPSEGGKATTFISSKVGIPNCLQKSVICSGNELHFVDCLYEDRKILNCPPQPVAGVQCEGFECEDGDVRLGPHGNETEGIVEICYNSTWGCVCDDNWDKDGNNAAVVVCGQLGYENGVKVDTCVRCDGMFWLDEVYCAERKTNLLDCVHNDIGVHDCIDTEAVQVKCYNYSRICQNCPKDAVCEKNANGNFTCECKAGYTGNGTFCEGLCPNCIKDAVCVKTKGIFTCKCKAGYTGNGTSCEDIDECKDNIDICGENAVCANLEGSFKCICNCGYTSDGTCCEECVEKPNCTEVNGRRIYDCKPGYAIYQNCCIVCEKPINGKCEIGFTLDQKNCCVCKNEPFDVNECPIGYTLNQKKKCCIECDKEPLNGQCEMGYILNQEINCCVCENRPSNDKCDNGFILDQKTNNCCVCQVKPSNEKCPVGFTLNQTNNCCVCKSGFILPGDICVDIRLVDGNETSGLVEVFYDCDWKSVCDDYWTDADGNVACKHLGFLPYCASAFLKGRFKRGEDVQYWLDDVQCKGDEDSLFHCKHRQPIGKHNCGRKERAGVHCLNESDLGIRLVKGSTNLSGIVEVSIRGEWRSVCDDHWTKKDAMVACRDLGLPHLGAKEQLGGEFSEGEEVKYWLDNVVCEGDEESLFACHHLGKGRHNCGKKQRAGVDCGGGKKEPHGLYAVLNRERQPRSVECPAAKCVEGSIKLVRNESDMWNDTWSDGEGLVQICVSSEWRYVCDDRWDENATRVVCKELEMLTEASTSSSSSYFLEENRVHYWLDDVQCIGNESSLLDCGHQSVGTHDCGPNERIAVVCNGTSDTHIPRQGTRMIGPSPHHREKVTEYAIAANATVIGDGISGIVEFDPTGENMMVITVDVDIKGLDASVLYDWGISSDTVYKKGCQVECPTSPYDPTDQLMKSCNYKKHCNDKQKDKCADGDYSVLYKPLDGSGRQTIMDNRTGLLELIGRFLFLQYDGKTACGIIIPEFECMEGDIVMTIVANQQFLGPLEVCIHNAWHRVCDSNWTKADATVACKQLELEYEGAVAVYFNEDEVLGPRTGNVTDGCVCTGDESSYDECEDTLVSTFRKDTEMVAGALCQKDTDKEDP